MHVLMPYGNRHVPAWPTGTGSSGPSRWASSSTSTGKEVFAGAHADQGARHDRPAFSQVQLYREGPNDKVVGFMEVEQFERDVTIPAGLNVETLTYLHEKSFAELLNAEKRATEYALVASQRPNFTLKFPTLDAYHVGQFMYFWAVTTSYAGLMLNINAYDQPAVELGKQATFGLMGRPGFEEFRSKVDDTLAPTDRIIHFG
jgi:glucose-6-phosphate isomerase